MDRVFVDASVLYAAITSPSGGSAALLEFAIAGMVELVISDDVVLEVERNLPHLRQQWRELLELVPFTFTNPTSEDVTAALVHAPAKDAHIVAAAIVAQAGFLATFDKRHLLNNQALKRVVPLQMVVLGTIVQRLRGQSSGR